MRSRKVLRGDGSDGVRACYEGRYGRRRRVGLPVRRVAVVELARKGRRVGRRMKRGGLAAVTGRREGEIDCVGCLRGNDESSQPYNPPDESNKADEGDESSKKRPRSLPRIRGAEVTRTLGRCALSNPSRGIHGPVKQATRLVAPQLTTS